MKIWLLMVSAALVLSGCSNPELQACEEKAGKLWNTSPKSKSDNAPYWRAIEACKKRYDK